MMGSTSNALDKGGENFKKLYHDSDVEKRNANGQTRSGLYSLFIPMNGTTKDTLILMDFLYSTRRKRQLRDHKGI